MAERRDGLPHDRGRERAPLFRAKLSLPLGEELGHPDGIKDCIERARARLDQ